MRLKLKASAGLTPCPRSSGSPAGRSLEPHTHLQLPGNGPDFSPRPCARERPPAPNQPGFAHGRELPWAAIPAAPRAFARGLQEPRPGALSPRREFPPTSRGPSSSRGGRSPTVSSHGAPNLNSNSAPSSPHAPPAGPLPPAASFLRGRRAAGVLGGRCRAGLSSSPAAAA